MLIATSCASWRGNVKARPAELQTWVPLSNLDSGLLMNTEKINVGHTNEGPFLVWPEHDDRSTLRSLSCNVKVGEANATQVGSQTNENVPVKAKFELTKLPKKRLSILRCCCK